MRPEELRIGNLVKWYDSIIMLDGVTQAYVTTREPNMEVIDQAQIEGISLTPEWLEGLGFRRTQSFEQVDEYSLPFNYKFKIQTDLEVFGMSGGNGLCEDLDLKYVHQLQNLYYALTGTELIFKP